VLYYSGKITREIRDSPDSTIPGLSLKIKQKRRKMKKHLKRKGRPQPEHIEPDITGIIIKMQQQLTFLEKKIDTLIGQASTRPAEERHRPRQFQHFDRVNRQGETKQANSYRERTLHKAICADCNKECEVPFRPSGDRPVYCKECFSKRKAGSSFKPSTDNRPRQEELIQERPSHKHRRGENRRPEEKKKIFKRQKRRS